MNLSEEELALIEAYLRKELSADKMAEVEAKITDNPDWQEAIRLHQDLEKAFDYNEANRLKQHLKSAGIKKTPTYLRWAAAAVLLIFLTGVFYFISSTKDYQKQYEAFYQPYPNIENPQERGEETFDSAFLYYEASRYQEALKFLEKRKGNAARFYSGQCYLALEDYAAARNAFQSVDADDPTYGTVSVWYLALTELQLQNPDRAKELLQNFAIKPDYQEKAARLLKALE